MGENSGANGNGEAQAMEEQLKFEEYKLIVENTQKMSERRQSATRTYLTVNTIILAAYGFLSKNGGLQQAPQVTASALIALVGVIACVTWLGIIIRFKTMIGWRYEQIKEIEDTLKWSTKLFSLEGGQKFMNTKWAFSNLEAFLPCLFILVHIVYGALLPLAFHHGWFGFGA